MGSLLDVTPVTFSDIRVIWSDIRYTAFWRGVAPAAPRRVTSAPQAGSTSSLRAGRLIPRGPVDDMLARGARRSRDTSAAQRLSNDFSYLLASISLFLLPRRPGQDPPAPITLAQPAAHSLQIAVQAGSKGSPQTPSISLPLLQSPSIPQSHPQLSPKAALGQRTKYQTITKRKSEPIILAFSRFFAHLRTRP